MNRSESRQEYVRLSCVDPDSPRAHYRPQKSQECQECRECQECQECHKRNALKNRDHEFIRTERQPPHYHGRNNGTTRDKKAQEDIPKLRRGDILRNLELRDKTVNQR